MFHYPGILVGSSQWIEFNRFIFLINDKVRERDNAAISLESNPSTAFENNILSSVEIRNNWLESFCIIVGGRRGNKRNRDLT